ncbi:SDR family NAD(P)-dependent oxidoreductase [Neptuniibacter halophilus]|uniref:SDR family NAD(P)-dependent oxidoreductase n=1 Tax=Neptuniibacter halophilus TaxID=651666 RepID=UPI00257294C9|nr:SDR family oxidoreductase [Neptuniibacter halophilus]
MNKVCIVTGGSAGIGAAVVERLLREGYQVFNFDLAPSGEGEFVACDMADRGQVEQAVAEVVQRCGRIDAVVSNAGIHFSGTLENTTEADLDRVFSINVKGAYYLLQATLPTMRAQRSGSVVLLGSDQSLIGKSNSFAYNLSKAALASMARTTALDYAEYGIRANAVCPGTIETPLYHQAVQRYCDRSGADKAEVDREEAALQPLGRLGQPEEVAALIALLVGDEARFITGSLQVIDGGYTAR